MLPLKVFVLLSWLTAAVFTDTPCVIELECEECLPENMPLVTSHRAAGAGVVRAAAGETLRLSCRGGRFVAYPLRQQLAAVCEAGRLRVREDNALRHLLELGCQENMFEDVLHEVEGCGAPLQGRGYQLRGAEGGGGGARHLATLCFDADRALAVRLRASAAPHNALPLRAHREPAGPLSLLGNFNHMFDAATRAAAERLYGDAARLNRRLAELLKHDGVAFADQTLVTARLLSPAYFDDENARVADFASNKVAAWRSVAAGNLAHAQRDVAALLRGGGGARLEVLAGTHGVAALRSAAAAGERRELYLKPGRFPVPRYIWTVVHDRARGRAAALVTLNDPFVAVSEIRAAIFCESACAALPWLRELRAARRWETPLYGLVFCCNIHDFTDVVTELPEDDFRNVPRGSEGLLTELEL